MQEQRKSIKRNSAVYMIKTLMNVLFPLITFKYASNVIMASGIGAANVSSAIIGYVGLISSLGISAYAIAEGSKIRRDKDALSEFVSEVFTINLWSMACSYCVLATLLFAVSRLEPYRLLILIYSSTILFNAIGIEWYFTIEERFGYITIRSIVFQAVSLVLLFILVRDKGDVPWYVTLTAISSAGSGILNFLYSRKSIQIGVSPFRKWKKHLKPILIIWAANVASLIYVNADTIIIGLMRGDAQVGYYSAAVKVIKAICIPIASISVVAGPQLAEAISELNQERINKISKQVIDFMSFFIFPCMVGLFLLGRQSILLISGEEFMPGLMSERILLIDILLSPLNGFIANQIMIPIKKEKKSMVAMILAALVNIILDVVLIRIIGINGAAIATVVSEMLVLLLCAPYVLETIDLKSSGKDVWKYALASLIIIPCYFVVSEIISNAIVMTAVMVLLSALLYILIIGVLTRKNPKSMLGNNLHR